MKPIKLFCRDTANASLTHPDPDVDPNPTAEAPARHIRVGSVSGSESDDLPLPSAFVGAFRAPPTAPSNGRPAQDEEEERRDMASIKRLCAYRL
ncbi:hypothetical protein BHE74_00027483 [Ensete ventricosum]|nr:hypothetical protein BHE74_00027483 [Ensete ventricosum]